MSEESFPQDEHSRLLTQTSVINDILYGQFRNKQHNRQKTHITTQFLKTSNLQKKKKKY